MLFINKAGPNGGVNVVAREDVGVFWHEVRHQALENAIRNRTVVTAGSYIVVQVSGNQCSTEIFEVEEVPSPSLRVKS